MGFAKFHGDAGGSADTRFSLFNPYPAKVLCLFEFPFIYGVGARKITEGKCAVVTAQNFKNSIQSFAAEDV